MAPRYARLRYALSVSASAVSISALALSYYAYTRLGDPFYLAMALAWGAIAAYSLVEALASILGRRKSPP